MSCPSGSHIQFYHLRIIESDENIEIDGDGIANNAAMVLRQ